MAQLTRFNGVRRRTQASYAVLYRTKPKPIVVTLAANDTLIFRELGRRAHWTITADDAFRYVVRCQALAQSRVKYQARMARRNATLLAARIKRKERQLFSNP